MWLNKFCILYYPAPQIAHKQRALVFVALAFDVLLGLNLASIHQQLNSELAPLAFVSVSPQLFALPHSGQAPDIAWVASIAVFWGDKELLIAV